MSDDTKPQHDNIKTTKTVNFLKKFGQKVKKEWMLQAVQVVGFVAKSTPLTVASVALDAVDVGLSVYDDKKNATTRNTVTSMSTNMAGMGGGLAGGLIGATAGTAILPGVGTLIGGILGGVAGGIGAKFGTEKAVNKVGDNLEYDIEILTCKECGEEYECRVYKTGRKFICESCKKG